MPQLIKLNKVAHKNLRVITGYSARFGDNSTTAMLVPTEFARAQREYPIFFRKDPGSGEYMAMALLGLQKDENLFLEEGGPRMGWQADYVPGVVARGPFFIGFEQREAAGKIENVAVIHVDVEHPRISQTEGELLFQPDGNNTRFLDQMADLLNVMHQGLQLAKPMYEAFSAADLFTPVQLEIKTSADEQYNLTGMHTLSVEKLAALEGETLERMHRSGYLQAAYLVAASAGNVQRLIDIKARRRRQTAMAS
jgi:hypothetical protein